MNHHVPFRVDFIEARGKNHTDLKLTRTSSRSRARRRSSSSPTIKRILYGTLLSDMSWRLHVIASVSVDVHSCTNIAHGVSEMEGAEDASAMARL